MFDPDCKTCRLREHHPAIADRLDANYRAGASVHSLHRDVERVLGSRAPSRSSIFRHFSGDAYYRAHVDADERAQHDHARTRGQELRGAAATSVKMSRSRPRGSARLVEQVARLLVQRNLIPREVFAEVGLDVPGAPPVKAAMYMTPEERSIQQGWGSGRWHRR